MDILELLFISWGLLISLLLESLQCHGQAGVLHGGSCWLFKYITSVWMEKHADSRSQSGGWGKTE